MNKNKYPEIALCAVDQLQRNAGIEPPDAWDKAASIFYPENESAKTKSCPKSSFLGLCEEGFVRGVEAGSYTKSKKNKKDALKGLKLLRKNRSLSKRSGRELWKQIAPQKTYNQQMDVVLALFKKDYLADSQIKSV